MQKQERDFTVQYSLDWTCGVEIAQLKKDVEELEKLAATHVNIEPYTEYDCSYVSIEAISRRMETDEECEERVRQITQRFEEEKRIELQELERLKSKYGL